MQVSSSVKYGLKQKKSIAVADYIGDELCGWKKWENWGRNDEECCNLPSQYFLVKRQFFMYSN